MKIVIADDEILIRKGISMTLPWKELGIDRVFEASDGVEALKIISGHTIDILLTDIKMPKMDGLELLDKVSAISPNTVNIVLSCVNDMECVRTAMKFNKAVDYIPKLTMSTDELQSVIRRATMFVKEHQGKNRNKREKLPLFFGAEYESRLRKVMEYGTQEELSGLLSEIMAESLVLGNRWKESSEWEELVDVFASVGKKYKIYAKDYLHEKTVYVCKHAEALDEMGKGIVHLAFEMKEKIEEEKRKSYDAVIHAASDYILKNYKNNMKLGEVADFVGMSESYFSRYFKRVIGEGFSEYLNKVRIEKAKELLRERKVTMQEAAEAVGYSNSAYFTQIFKSIEGLSPKSYQKQFFEQSSN